MAPEADPTNGPGAGGNVRRAIRAGLLTALVALASPEALGAGRPSLNAYFQSTLKDAAYQKKAFDRVAKTWKSPAAGAYPKVGAKVVVQAVIRKDGAIVSTSVSTASGSKAWDEAAVAAVKAAGPFDALPAGYGHPTLEVHFHVSVVP